MGLVVCVWSAGGGLGVARDELEAVVVSIFRVKVRIFLDLGVVLHWLVAGLRQACCCTEAKILLSSQAIIQ